MPTIFECNGKIPGEKLTGTFTHDYNAGNKTVTFDNANFDAHFEAILDEVNKKDGKNPVVIEALESLSRRDVYVPGFVYTVEEAMQEFSDSAELQKTQGRYLTFPEAFVKTAMLVKQELVKTVEFGGSEEDRQWLKPLVKNLIINGDSAVDILNSAVSANIKAAAENKKDTCQGMERFDNLAPWQRNALDYE